MAARWRKEPSLTGLARVGQGPRGLQLCENGEVIIGVRPLTPPWKRYEILGWFWAGMGKNTAHSPVKTMAEAKQQATEYFKQHRKT